MKAVAEAELAVNLVVLVPLTENMPTHSSPVKKIYKKFIWNVKAVAEAELAVNLVVLVPLTENMTIHSSPQKIYKKKFKCEGSSWGGAGGEPGGAGPPHGEHANTL